MGGSTPGRYAVLLIGTTVTIGTVWKSRQGWHLSWNLPEPDRHGRTVAGDGWTYTTRTKAVDSLLRGYVSMERAGA